MKCVGALFAVVVGGGSDAGGRRRIAVAGGRFAGCVLATGCSLVV